ncbi:MAG TPA: hypothetical protein VIW94_08935 [Acidimicrobiia bacterium]
MAIDWETAELDDQTLAMVRFAEKLTRTPSAIGADDIENLRAVGLDDRGISSCVQVISYFNYINRIAEGLGISPEDWIDDTGRVKGRE